MIFQEEIRKGFIVTMSMKKVWNIQMNMAVRLIDVCKKYGIRIWCAGGTLLGAVREHGFIPWDDDMDFYIFREDYDKLVSIANDEFKSPFHFQCARTEKRYFRGHAQLRYDGTSAILPNDIWQSFHQGIFIDIFVLDGLPTEGRDEFKMELYKAYAFQETIFNSEYFKWSLFHPKMWTNTLKSFCQCIKVGKSSLYNQYEKICSEYSFEDCEYVACTVYDRPTDKWLCFQKDWFNEIKMVPFEDIMIPIPAKYHEVLSFQYGQNYMIPQQSSAMHGGFAVLDADIDYKESLKILRKQKMIETIKKICHLK